MNAGSRACQASATTCRDLLASSDPRAKLALDYFVYRIALFTGMLAAAMGGIDGFVFTAGIGENAPAIREAVAKRLGLARHSSLILHANAKGERRDLARRVARVSCYVIPTDEELMIARHTLRVLRTHAGNAA